jgi:hypothetical protein
MELSRRSPESQELADLEESFPYSHSSIVRLRSVRLLLADCRFSHSLTSNKNCGHLNIRPRNSICDGALQCRQRASSPWCLAIHIGIYHRAHPRSSTLRIVRSSLCLLDHDATITHLHCYCCIFEQYRRIDDISILGRLWRFWSLSCRRRYAFYLVIFRF